MEVAFIAQFFLCQFHLDATFPDTVTQGAEKMAVLKVHAGRPCCRLA
jgi:hypothetical protein